MRRRIVVTGDVLRPRQDAFLPQLTGNILWLHRLLRRPLAAATGLEVQALAWDPGSAPGATGFDTPGFYAAAGATPDIAGWVRLFDAETLPRDAAARLAAPFEDAAVVIGFELAEMQKRLLSQLGIAWVDLNIHPVRFGPDLFFAVQTNHAGILAGLVAHHAEDAVFEPWADWLAAMAVKMPIAPAIEEQVLLVGQTRVDRSLIAQGRLIDLRDVAATFHREVGAAPRLLFRAHPYEAGDFGLHELGLPRARIRRVEQNAYLLLAQDSLRRVIGVSSSLIAEARFFGKEGIFLGPSPFRIAPRRSALAPLLHASVVEAWLWADFWRDLLAPLMPVSAQDGLRPSLGPNALRLALRQFWGWDEIAFQLPFDLARRGAGQGGAP